MAPSGQFSVCVLLYGDYPDLAKRCLGSIETSLDEGQTLVHDFRIGLNAVAPGVFEYVARWAQDIAGNRGLPVYLFVPPHNVGKCPLMRRMFYQRSIPLARYVMWFDDDSFLVPTPGWWQRVAEMISRADVIGQTGWGMPIRGNQWEWVCSQPCFNAGRWRGVDITVVKTRYFWISDQGLDRVLRHVSEFYHRMGIQISWRIETSLERHSDLRELDIDLYQNECTRRAIMQQSKVKWYFERFEDKLTVFLIDDIDLKNWRPGVDLLGLSAGNFCFVPDVSGLGDYNGTIVHELGHSFELDHVTQGSNFMYGEFLFQIENMQFQPWQAERVRRGLESIDDPDPAADWRVRISLTGERSP